MPLVSQAEERGEKRPRAKDLVGSSVGVVEGSLGVAAAAAVVEMHY